MDVIKRGARGPAVAEIRGKLTSLGLLAAPAEQFAEPAEEALFDGPCDAAVRQFQQSRGLSVDGTVGAETYRALDDARWRLGDRLLFYRVGHPFTGDDVAQLQWRLQELGFNPGRADGIFGAHTEQAMREFQRNVGLSADGTCGPQTLKALARLQRTVVGGQPQVIREAEAVHRAGPSLAGKLVVIDPGHGGDDPGAQAGDLDEQSIAFDLASRLLGRLTAVGAFAFLTRGADVALDAADRAQFANAAEADLLISLHCDVAPSPHCNGVSAFYFGSDVARGMVSSAGERLASLVQREIAVRTGLLDCRSHRKTWELLRLTRMPAVRVEIGYLSNAEDAVRLAMPEFRDAVAEAILVGIQRFYLPAELDAPTGQLRLTELIAVNG